MARPRFSRDYAKMIAERATELANMALAGMVFVQFAPETAERARFSAVVIGLIAFWVLHILAFLVLRQGGDER